MRFRPLTTNIDLRGILPKKNAIFQVFNGKFNNLKPKDFFGF